MALLNALGNLHSSFPVPTDPNPLLCQGMASAVPQLPPRTESGHALRGTGHSPVPECRGTSQKVILAGGQEPDDREARALPLRLCTSFIGPAPRCRGRECWQSRGQASTDPAGPGYHRSSRTRLAQIQSRFQPRCPAAPMCVPGMQSRQCRHSLGATSRDR